jgi:cell division GTPase FtsZ
MKLLVIGFGQCGGRVADEFARLGIRARIERGIDIITGAFAVNTDVADLSGLSTIRSDYQHRVLIGGQRTGGRGVGKINELGAEIAREDGDKIIDAMRTVPRLAETDAILLIASAAGGTGSGAIATVTQRLKQRYIEKPLYNLIVLPFRHEEEVEGRTIFNSATCLKSVYLTADAVILVDNERYVSKTTSIRNNLAKINALIVEPFYNVLCAGEEKKFQYIGSRILDGGDIIQTLAGWTVIGYSKSRKARVKNPFDFREKMTESQRGVQVMNNALAELSLNCDPKDAGRGLYLLSASPKEMEMNLVSDIGAHLKRLAPEAIIRTGDYPRGDGTLTVTVILSELSGVSKLVNYFTHTIELLSIIKKRREGIELEHRDLREAFRDIPTLL